MTPDGLLMVPNGTLPPITNVSYQEQPPYEHHVTTYTPNHPSIQNHGHFSTHTTHTPGIQPIGQQTKPLSGVS